MKVFPFFPLPLWSAAFFALAAPGARADLSSDSLRKEFQQAQQVRDHRAVAVKGWLLIPLLEKAGATVEAADVALDLSWAVDMIGTPEEGIAAAGEARRLVTLSRAGAMRPWDWMLLAKMAGTAVKHHLREGRLIAAGRQQALSWSEIKHAIRQETGADWEPGQALPASLSADVLGILLRTARYDAELLSVEGRCVEAVARLRRMDDAVVKSGMEGGIYGAQLLALLVSELKFLGYWEDSLAGQRRILAGTAPGSSSHLVARANLAYWRSRREGPIPALLDEVREAAAQLKATESQSTGQATRRMLARMAYAYRAAGFDIGDLAAVVQEAEAAGDRMEAVYARRDLAVIQLETLDFAPAEANLLATLAEVRASGRKRSEPTLYREYASLLLQTGRPLEATRMIREALRLTKGFQWIQHLPTLLHVLAQAQHAAGDTPGLRATLAELQALVTSGKLEAERRLDAAVAIALCQQALGQPPAATAALQQALAAARQDGLPAWMIAWAEKFPLGDIQPHPPVPAAAPPAADPGADLQPVKIHSTVLPGETARVRFTLSNPAAAEAVGTLILEGAHLTATWQDDLATGRLTTLASGGETQLRHALTLRSGEEFLLLAEGLGETPGTVQVRWEPASGSPQQAHWTLTRAENDGSAIAVTNASRAGRNPFYAVRLHHALNRRHGDPATPVDLRMAASRPMRLELLAADTGGLLAVDANGDGQFDGPGDLLIADQNHDGFPDLVCPAGRPIEFALLLYPLTAGETATEASIDIQLRTPHGWETAARDLLK